MLGLGLGVDKIRPSGVLPLLDLYPATAAYSLRALSSSTTNVVKVREDGLNQEQDFTAKEITDGTLATFCGANNGFVVTWYDQAGSNDATQATAGSQPKIYDSSTGVILENGRAAVDFLSLDFMDITSTSSLTTFAVYKIQTFTNVNYIIQNISPLGGLFVGGTITEIDGVGLFDGTSAKSMTNNETVYSLAYWHYNGTNFEVAHNNSSINNLANGENAMSSINAIGRTNNIAATQLNSTLQELIFYNSDQSANRTKIEQLINSHYNIYS